MKQQYNVMKFGWQFSQRHYQKVQNIQTPGTTCPKSMVPLNYVKNLKHKYFTAFALNFHFSSQNSHIFLNLIKT